MTLRSSLFLTSRILFPKESATHSARRSLLGAVLCIALSLIPLVVVLTVTEGMIQGITGRLIGLSSYHLQIAQTHTIADAAQNLEMLEELRAMAESLPGVTGAFIERQGTVLAAGPKGRSGALVRAVSPDLFERNTAFQAYCTVLEGSSEFTTPNTALVGKKIAETLGLSTGDSVRLISSRTNAGGNTVPVVKSFKVGGIVSSGYQEIDALWVFVPLETGFGFLSTMAGYICVGVETADPYSAGLDGVFRGIAWNLPKGFQVYRWQELNAAQYENFASTRVMLVFVMFLIVLVASMNISSALVMLVLEKRKDIAVLKSVGASPSGIAVTYIATGAFAGFAGVLAGIPLGLLCAVNVNEILSFVENFINVVKNILYTLLGGEEAIPVQLLNPAYYLESIPIIVPVPRLVIAALGTIALSVVVSVVPAVGAGKEKPLAVLRKV